MAWLKDFYGVSADDQLRRSAYDDWRVCLPVTIALEDDTVPGTPRVLMVNDPNWFGLDNLAVNLRTLINGG